MGRTSILMVMGFNIIFALLGINMGGISSQAYKNYINYYNVAQTRLLTESAANLVLGQVSADAANIPPYSTNNPAEGGYYSIDTSDETEPFTNFKYKVFTIVGTFGGIIDTTIVKETRSSFSQYAMYSINENGIFWKAGEVCNGPLYTGGTLNIDGNPTFTGNVTAIGNWQGDAQANPQFNGGFRRGPAVTLPTDLSSVRSDALNGGRRYTTETYVDFRRDGTVIVCTGSYTGTQVAGSPFASVTAFSGNGTLAVDGANLHIKGTITGQMTVASLRNGGTGGTVIIEDTMTYNTPPLLPDGTTNPACTDMLGIIADNNVTVSQNVPTNETIHASIMARTNGFGAENTGRTPVGTLTLVGGIQQQNRLGVGTFNSGTGQMIGGFIKNYSYDQRFRSRNPPSYPLEPRYRVLSWYDRVRWDKGLFD